MQKTLGLPDYRSKYGCLRCFQGSDEINNLAAPIRKRKHSWLVDTGKTSLSLHECDDDGVEALRENCTVRRKRGGVVLKRLVRDEFPLLQRGDRLEPSLPGFPDVWHGERCEDYEPQKRMILMLSASRTPTQP
eukprot:468340-Pyramimonas_sp.AAC.1